MGRKKKQTSKHRKRNKQCSLVRLDPIYKVINKVQSDRKKRTISIEDKSLMPIIENILRDSGITYEIIILKKKIHYHLHPCKINRALEKQKMHEIADGFFSDESSFFSS
jgi:hypothetical protein